MLLLSVLVVGEQPLLLNPFLAGNTTTLYCRRPEFADQLATDLENKDYLPGVALPKELQYSSDLESSIRNAEVVLMVTPSVHVRTSLESIKPLCT